MQTTLECPATSSVNISVDTRNTTLILSDEHFNYLYDNFSEESRVSQQIEKQLEDEENEAVEIKKRYDDFLKYEKKSKSQKYIRVGKKC